MALTVAEAKEKRICRVCEQPVGVAEGLPKDWPEEFGEMTFPVEFITAFGEEFAHARCLPEAEVKRFRAMWDRPTAS